MFRLTFQPKNLLKNSSAALLVLILSGVFYLVCCRVMMAAEKAEHCPLTKTTQTEHCNFSKRADEKARTATSINLFECCQLKFNFFVAKLEKKRLPHAAPARASNFFSLPESIKHAGSPSETDFSYRAPAFESRDLHIKNCVFRI
jgi:hypothetical protein